jgi:hypothetical protein
MAMRSDSLSSLIIDIFNPAQQISVLWLVSFMLEPLKALRHNNGTGVELALHCISYGFNNFTNENQT